MDKKSSSKGLKGKGIANFVAKELLSSYQATVQFNLAGNWANLASQTIYSQPVTPCCVIRK